MLQKMFRDIGHCLHKIENTSATQTSLGEREGWKLAKHVRFFTLKLKLS